MDFYLIQRKRDYKCNNPTPIPYIVKERKNNPHQQYHQRGLGHQFLGKRNDSSTSIFVFIIEQKTKSTVSQLKRYKPHCQKRKSQDNIIISKIIGGIYNMYIEGPKEM